MEDAEPGPAQEDARARAARRRRLAEIFGDVLPEQTRDDAGDPADRPADRGASDPGEEWLRRQVPPHHR